MKIWNREDCKASLPITAGELADLGITEKDIAAGEKRGNLKTSGPWNIPVSYRAICMSMINTYPDFPSITHNKTAYGIRTLTAIRQSGYELEGRVSIGGRKYSAFTSSQLFELPDGRLVDVAIIHARVR
jgi:hypothetical protein